MTIASEKIVVSPHKKQEEIRELQSLLYLLARLAIFIMDEELDVGKGRGCTARFLA